jgi:hypothetical protein
MEIKHLTAYRFSVRLNGNLKAENKAQKERKMLFHCKRVD